MEKVRVFPFVKSYGLGDLEFSLLIGSMLDLTLKFQLQGNRAFLFFFLFPLCQSQ